MEEEIFLLLVLFWLSIRKDYNIWHVSSRTCLGSEKVKKNKGSISQLPSSPRLTHKSLHPWFSSLPFEHFYLNLLLVASVTATAGPAPPAAFQVSAGEENPWDFCDIRCSRFFLLLCMCGSIYVYILNSMYVITEYSVTWSLYWFCPDGVLCCHKRTHRLQWLNSQLEIGFLPCPANYWRL